MEKKSIKEMKDLEKTLKLCVKLGVSEIKFGDTHVIFGEVSKQPRKPRKAVVKEQVESAYKADLQAQYDEVMEDLSVSHIEDPLGYENAIAAGLLGNETTDDSRAQ